MVITAPRASHTMAARPSLSRTRTFTLAGVNDVDDRADDPDRASPIPLLPILRTVLSFGPRHRRSV
jgi:hypothetical protein